MTADLWDEPIEQGAGGPERPRDLDAEHIVVANVMRQPELIDDLAADFDPADITDDRLRWVWHAVDEIRQTLTGSEIRYEAVNTQLQNWRASGYLPIVPLTRDQLVDLYGRAQPGSTAWYAASITKKAAAARLVAHGYDAISRGRSAAFDPDADVAASQNQLDGVLGAVDQANMALAGDLLAGSLERSVTKPTTESRIPTGFIDLDLLLAGGWAPGQMIVVGARPAMGKTTFALNLARAAAVKNGIPTLFQSLEMSKEDLIDSMMCAEAQVALHHFKQATIDPAGLARLPKAAALIQPAPLRINETGHLSIPLLRGQVRHLVRTAGLRLVIIDYLQLMYAPKAENRQQAVADMSRQLKLMAKEFGITIIVLAQLNRGPEQRTEKRPMVSDLRESGAIEQDADIVILLHREDAYDRESPRAGEADLIVGKHRGGHPGDITVAFQGHYARFVDMAQEAS
ncbi:DnaB-like helicase C-terminal domain-containing protein [Streptomyces sp. NPDC046866]|uniref:DnaB-like helicase C-terminal domain-containing protein n=1 Tax=Streptomyces sp. NPDC046866 TaxID=3154921 RepID=UPI0034561304